MNTVEYRDGAVWLIDQTRLPLDPRVIACRDVEQLAEAIVSLRVRGAPAIGLAAAFGVAMAAEQLAGHSVGADTFQRGVIEAMDRLRSTRPTAVNLFWALERMRGVLTSHQDETPRAVADALAAEAEAMLRDDEATNRRMGEHGATLIPDGANVLTHCNTGALATGAFGTSLGAIRAAHEQGKRIHVWVDETRPLLQGARLTAWELKEAGVPFTLITDSMAGHFMARGQVDLAMVGADRVAANGDTANKIGTYSVAVLCHYHDLPFYIVAPTSTVDLATPSGANITIEERKPDEVAGFGGVRVAPEGIGVANPAFDVTPAGLIAGIVTERGVVRPPFEPALSAFAGPELSVAGSG